MTLKERTLNDKSPAAQAWRTVRMIQNAQGCLGSALDADRQGLPTAVTDLKDALRVLNQALSSALDAAGALEKIEATLAFGRDS